MNKRARRSLTVLATVMFTGALASPALADQIINDIDDSIDSGRETVTLSVPNADETTIRVQPTGSDGKSGCNLTGSTSTTFSVTSSDSTVASVSPSSITFGSCDETKLVTVTAVKAGTADISFAVTANSSLGTWDAAPANFRVSVSAPADTTPPVITPQVTGTLGDNGWYTSNVSVSWSVTDAQSAITSTSGCGTTTVSSDTTGRTITCQATSAGGTSSEDVTIKRDATDPTGVATTLNRLADHNGWYNAAVGWTTSGSDATSGIASCSSGTYNGPDGTNRTVSGTCRDRAGNTSAPAVSDSFDYDNTAPTLSPSVNPDPVLLNGSATASPGAADATSGVNAGATGCDRVDTSSVGSQTVACRAQDNAGNTANANATYSVQYRFAGFFQPVDMAGLNAMKGGATAPIKFQLLDANGAQVTALSAVARATSGVMACNASAPVDNLEEYTTGSTQLRYDATGGQFIYNWQSPKQPGKCFKVVLGFADGTSQSASFQLK